MSTVEIRVRPVIRHIVTRFTEERTSAQDKAPAYSRKLETLGEFDNEAQAEEVAAALRAGEGEHCYAVVQATGGDIDAEVYYAYDLAEAEQMKTRLETDGKTFRIYSRPNKA
jgi:hypothetical protein